MTFKRCVIGSGALHLAVIGPFEDEERLAAVLG
jgi:hypothetical protein